MIAGISRFFLMLTVSLSFLGSLFLMPVQAQDNDYRTKAENALRATLADQPPLMEADISAYRRNLQAIYQLSLDPAKVPETLNATGWTENRLTYVTTKISVGMTQLLSPNSPKLAQMPDFTKPTEAELVLLDQHRDALVQAIDQVMASGD